MKNILITIDSLDCGGAEKSLISLLSLLDYSQYSVDLLLFKRGGIFEEFIPTKVNMVKPLKYSEFTRLSLSQSILHSIKHWDFKMLKARIRFTIHTRKNKKKVHGAQLLWNNIASVVENHKKEYEVAIAYSQGFPTYYVGEKVTAKKKIAWVNTNYNLAGYDKKYDYRFYEKFTNIITVSYAGKEMLAEVFPEFSSKIGVLYDINNPGLIGKMAEGGESYTDNFSGIRLLTVGRLAAPKGYDIAAAACKKLKEKGIHFRWYIVGDGMLRSEIEEDIKQNHLQDHLILLGAKSNPYPYIKNCHIYVQTSKFEGFGLAIAEARMLNKPIVTTNFSGVDDQIIDGENGLIVAMNSHAVCDGIIKMLADNGLRNKIITHLKNEKKGNVDEFDKLLNYLNEEIQSQAKDHKSNGSGGL